MSTRRYEQRLRAESAEDTRRRILDAVYQRLADAPAEALSVEQVARAAGVARSTVYVVFGSRAGLLEAFAEDLWERSGLARLTEAVAHPDAREHLRGGIRAASRMYAAERDIYRVLYSMAQLDPDSVGVAVRKMNEERSGGMAYVAQHLADQNMLRPDTSVEEATNILWVLCSFESLDLLRTGRGLPLEEAVDLIITTAERSVCR